MPKNTKPKIPHIIFFHNSPPSLELLFSSAVFLLFHPQVHQHQPSPPTTSHASNMSIRSHPGAKAKVTIVKKGPSQDIQISIYLSKTLFLPQVKTKIISIHIRPLPLLPYRATFLPPLNDDRRHLLEEPVLPGLHAADPLLDHDRRRNAALVLMTQRSRAVPPLDQNHLSIQKHNSQNMTTLCIMNTIEKSKPNINRLLANELLFITSEGKVK